MRRARIAWLTAAVALGGCTYGAPPAVTGSLAGGVVVVDVNLTVHPDGYSPDVLDVPVGTRIQFTNSDSFAHTASAIAAPSFPNASPFDVSAETPNQGTLSTRTWGSGVLQAGGSSPVFVADQAGTYLYGCFFHYGHPMQGEIVVH
jgi:plastocyanin